MPDGFAVYAFGSWIGINYKETALYQNKLLAIVSWIYIVFQFVTVFRWFSIFAQILFFIAVWFAMDIFEFRGKLPWWMQITFFTYVAHDVFLEAFEKVFLVVFGNAPIFAFLDYLFMPFLVLLVLIMIAVFMKRFMPKIWRILTGARD